MKDVTQLDQGWDLHHAGSRLPAAVPGCVHTDLLAAGLIPDPFLEANETDVAWVSRQDWTYTLDLPDHGTRHERTDLVFEGLDTAATITLGGTELGSTRNMHHG
ncbi:glycoside hydrolase family 2 protein, partial [Kitasatospora sp. NPDC058263]